MMREWLVSVFFHYNFFGLCCKSVAKYKRIPLDNIMSVELVDVDQTLCVSIFCYGYYGQYIDNFVDMESVVYLEQTHTPAYAFISDTLGLYLRILHRINPRLYCPLESDFFSVLTDREMFFSTIAPLMKDEKKTKDYDDDDDDEKEGQYNNIYICKYIAENGWIEDGAPLADYILYSMDAMFDLFDNGAMLNETQFIEAGAKFVSTVFNLVNEFKEKPVKQITKSIPDWEKEFSEIVKKVFGEKSISYREKYGI